MHHIHENRSFEAERGCYAVIGAFKCGSHAHLGASCKI
ncbi:hypothetical protein CAMGR0001_0220 [Campylobacter gracilis RM3268]|uniref:Uncharacterized protein n=1 Tax=Campylobacter gracilis RM3268 TaxID=553220 RepID=C8PKJ8_9BACT|nr:hypothetical protein CAMGR0001_0220 [Campylobacter gracilis RM3268]